MPSTIKTGHWVHEAADNFEQNIEKIDSAKEDVVNIVLYQKPDFPYNQEEEIIPPINDDQERISLNSGTFQCPVSKCFLDIYLENA